MGSISIMFNYNVNLTYGHTQVSFFIKKTAKVEESQGVIVSVFSMRHELTVIIYVWVCKEVLYMGSHHSPSVMWEEVPTLS